jgi:hypothetical protein
LGKGTVVQVLPPSWVVANSEAPVEVEPAIAQSFEVAHPTASALVITEGSVTLDHVVPPSVVASRPPPEIRQQSEEVGQVGENAVTCQPEVLGALQLRPPSVVKLTTGFEFFKPCAKHSPPGMHCT